MIWILLVLLTVVGGITAVGIAVNERRKALPSGGGQKALPAGSGDNLLERTVRDLRVDDVLTIDGKDFLVEGLIDYDEDGHRWVAVEDGRVVGWVAAHTVSSRPCYRGVVEHSVYVDEEWQGRGIGRALLERLFASTEQDVIWTIQTGVFPENEASLKLHERCGFRVVGTQERLGKLDGVWRDVVVLERRSELIS